MGRTKYIHALDNSPHSKGDLLINTLLTLNFKCALVFKDL